MERTTYNRVECDTKIMNQMWGMKPFFLGNKTLLRKWNFTEENKSLVKGVSLAILESLVRNHKIDHEESRTTSTLLGSWKFHSIINTTKDGKGLF